MNLITERRLFPQFLRKFDCVVGVCLRECIDGSKWKKETVAHAHCDRRFKYKGVICIAPDYELALFDDRVMLHEVAHLLSPCGRGGLHNKKWRDTVVSIGGTYRAFASPQYKIPDLSTGVPIWRNE